MNDVFTMYGFVLFSLTLAISVFTKYSQQRYVDLERVRLKGTHRMSHLSFKLRIWIRFLLFMISTIIPTYNVKTGLIYTIVVCLPTTEGQHDEVLLVTIAFSLYYLFTFLSIGFCEWCKISADQIISAKCSNILWSTLVVYLKIFCVLAK